MSMRECPGARKLGVDYRIGKPTELSIAQATRMITSDHPDDRQRGRHGLDVKVRAVRRGSNVEIWLFDGDHPMQRGTVVKAALVADAGRRGQDLVDDLIGNALHDIERYGETSALSLRPRMPARRRDRRLQLRSAS